MVCTWCLVAMVLGGWCLAQEVSNETFAVYELSHKTAAQVEQLLQPLLPLDESVRIIADQKKNQLLVSADASIQTRVREFLKTIDQPSGPSWDFSASISITTVPSGLIRGVTPRMSPTFSKTTWLV